jgi:hypothetical protein
VENYVENYAREHKLQVSSALKKLLKQASTLNYMNIKGKFKITLEMLENDNYFNDLFTAWFQNQHQIMGKAQG